MTRRMRVLAELVEDSLYPIDDVAIAEAILLRAAVRTTLPGVALRTEDQVEQVEPVRSFRPDPRARSFRLETRRRRAVHA